MSLTINSYGLGENSYKAAGELVGITKLVDDFYHFMEVIPEAKTIRAMHNPELTLSRKKLTYFLSAWLGGPQLYSENFGSINIPQSHKHLSVGHSESDAWILCMEKALELQPYEDDFKVYLITQLRIPAERIRLAAK
jgi:hemoglobin